MSTPSPVRPPVVVAVDGSDSALAAVRWAACEASAHNLPLRLVHACVPPPIRFPTEPRVQADYLDALSDHGRHSLREAEALAGRTRLGLDIQQDLRVGEAVEVLLDAARGAKLLVTGSRGLGGFRSVLLGSVSAGVTAHAPCPVVVVRGDTPAEDSPVVVGVDGSPTSEAAVALAFEEASLHRVPLVAVHTWSDVAYEGLWTAVPMIVDFEALAADERRVLDERMAGWQEKYPDVAVTKVVERDRPVRALLAHAARARLLVVGSRSHHPFAGMGLGSTSQALVHHGNCPVVVVPAETE
ncbi:universal stress protein [Actinokineospora sp. NBRC 105648]|uniref:universal stress protein n=1 Tax=Actinokineospora sp. NBRC 105648 TaxID=3032206 RepID=UPI0024A4A218|nr:universal stress protein [Actinokineospora sp. NBRC 105648]GLZ36679.1 universal stress protein [Actinokineospora sp. NBRC 105648]